MNPKAGIPWISDIVLRPADAVNITMGKMSCSWKPRRTGFTSQSKRTLASTANPFLVNSAWHFELSCSQPVPFSCCWGHLCLRTVKPRVPGSGILKKWKGDSPTSCKTVAALLMQDRYVFSITFCTLRTKH